MMAVQLAVSLHWFDPTLRDSPVEGVETTSFHVSEPKVSSFVSTPVRNKLGN